MSRATMAWWVIFVIVSLVSLYFPVSAKNHIHFDLLDNRNGLTNNNVTFIFEDSQGYLWVGTREGGVNRFDGSGFESFSYKPTGDGLTHNYVTSIVEDRSGLIWIGTMGGGINYFNPKTLEIGNINSILNIISYLPSKIIHCLYIDSYDNLWIGSTGGLTRFSFSEQSFKTYHNEPQEGISLISNKVHSIVGISEGIVLAGTDAGLDYLNIEGGFSRNLLSGYEVRSIIKDESGAYWIGSNNGLYKLTVTPDGYADIIKQEIGILKQETISTLAYDASGNLWIGTNNNGAIMMEASTEAIHHFLPDQQTAFSISDRAVNHIYIDSNKTVWIGTNSAGINVYTPHRKPFYLLADYWENVRNLGSLNFTFLDSKERLWLATREGLHRYIKIEGSYDIYHLPVNNNFLCVSELSSGQIIVGTFGSGVYYFDEIRKSFLQKDFALLDEIVDQKVWYIKEDSAGDIWMGTIGNGVFRMSPGLQLVYHYIHDENNEFSLANNYVKQIVEDNHGNIWFITNHQGVSRLPNNSDLFIRYLHDEADPYSLPDNSVDDICMDQSGDLYFSTFDGLSMFDYETEKFINIKLSTAIKSVGIKGMLIDRSGNWWISAKDGIIKFDHTKGDFWEINDIGIHFGELKRSSIKQYRDGEILVSGTNEIIFFHPDLIRKNQVYPRLAFTNLYVNHERIRDFSEGSVLQQPLNMTEKIVLNPRQRNFNIEFTCLNIFASGQTQFSYMLDGYDADWIKAGDNRYATYTNLNPGQYLFRLTAANIDGIQAIEERTLQFVILPLWYTTTYFNISLALFLALIIFILVRLRIASLQRQRELLERLVHEKTKELENQKLQLEELSQIKNRFFTSISHEFKTPLTLILGPLENLFDRLKNEPDYHNYMSLISKSSKRLMGLVNQLLDVSKIESGKMNLNLVEADIIDFTHSIYNSFLERANRMNLSYRYVSDHKHHVVFFDPDKVEKILFNLLSNAFKFTPDNGTIEVILRSEPGSTGSDQDNIIIEVADSGTGIPADKLADVFDYFTSIGQGSSRVQGSGIGLSLVKQMTEVHKGHVRIESEENIGTRVIVSLRVDRGLLANDGVQLQTYEDAVLAGSQQSRQMHDFESQDDSCDIQEQYLLSDDAPYVLVIEDNADILLYIKDILKEKYNILAALEGCRGYEVAIGMVPDLIICDVMLPDSCGIDICKKIKENEMTNHIPIIVLTAMGGEENLLRGFESGVDNYITKPFNPQLLQLRVSNLINTRKNLIERFKLNFLSNELQVLRSKTNEIFVQKLVAIIEDNLENPDFGNDKIASSLHVSTRQLYRKLDGIIRMPLNKFIRHIKMKKALELMQTIPDQTISEIAYKVGFNDPKYFSKCFREEFGSLPSEMLKDSGKVL